MNADCIAIKHLFRPGDRVMSSQGHYGTVQCIHKMRFGRLYRVRWDSGFESRVSPTNLFHVSQEGNS